MQDLNKDCLIKRKIVAEEVGAVNKRYGAQPTDYSMKHPRISKFQLEKGLGN